MDSHGEEVVLRHNRTMKKGPMWTVVHFTLTTLPQEMDSQRLLAFTVDLLGQIVIYQ